MGSKNREIAFVIAGIILDPGTNSPIVILRSPSNADYCLPIWIGGSEASAIAAGIQKSEIVRPMTHDLLINAIDKLGGKIVKVCISSLEDNTFYAKIELLVSDMTIELDARPSDALAIASRLDCPITVVEDVIKLAQVELVTEGVDGEGGGGKDIGDVVEVAEVDPGGSSHNLASIDKERWEDILAEMDPEDFKYKM